MCTALNNYYWLLCFRCQLGSNSLRSVSALGRRIFTALRLVIPALGKELRSPRCHHDPCGLPAWVVGFGDLRPAMGPGRFQFGHATCASSEESGRLIGVKFDGETYPTSPATVFYDWLYFKALYHHREWLKRRAEWACVSAWNKDPVFGVIGIQSGPRGLRVHTGFHDYGSRGWDADCGDDCEDPPGIFC